MPTTPTYGSHYGLSITMPSRADVDVAKTMGFKWVRGGAECGWGPEAIANQLDVAKHARDIGIKFVWCSNLSTHFYEQTRMQEWTDYHTWIAACGVTRFEIGNEWNNNWTPFFAPYDPTWARQAAWSNVAGQAVKKIHPRALIVSGGMSPYGADDGGTTNQWPQRAIPLLWARLNVGLFNGVGNHLYAFPGDPRWRFATHPGWGACSRNRDVWDTIKQYGHPIFNTEFGSHTTDFQPTATKTAEEVRRDHFILYTTELDDQRHNYGVKFGAHFIHTLRDGNSVTQGETATMGLISETGKPKTPTAEYIIDLLKKPW